MNENNDVERVTKYHEQENPDYEGNPFIALFPPLSPIKLARLMGTRIGYSAERRHHANHLRTQYLLSFLKYYVPQKHQWEFAFKLWSLVMEGYQNNASSLKSGATEFEKLCDSIVAGVPPDAGNRGIKNSCCIVLIGTPGCGKTTTVQAIFSLLGRKIFQHTKHKNAYQKLAVFVTLTGAVGGRSLASSIYEALRTAAQATQHYVPQLSARATEADFRQAIKILIKKLNLGVLILDEVQHIYHGSGKMDETMMKFVTSLINELEIPVLLIGTWQALPLLSLEARIARRGFSPGNALFRRMKPGIDWENFVRGIFRFQYTHVTVDASDFINELYEHTQGVHDITIKFFVLCQLEAIADGSERLTLELMRDVAKKHLSVLAPWIKMMRDGRSEEDPKIYDAEPVDIDKYIKQFAEISANRTGRSKNSIPLDSSDLTYSTVLLAEALVAVGLAENIELAATNAADAVLKSPKRTVAEHVTAALNASKPKAPQRSSSKTPTQKSKELTAFSALNECDFRKISYLAVTEGRDVEAAFRAAGLLCSVTDDIEF